MIEQFIAAYMKDEPARRTEDRRRRRPQLLRRRGEVPAHRQSGAACASSSASSASRSTRCASAQPRISTALPAWEEFSWLDKTSDAGRRALAVFERTERCEATNVDPGTGARDMAIPAELRRAWGHSDFGIYAKVKNGGAVAVGDGAVVG